MNMKAFLRALGAVLAVTMTPAAQPQRTDAPQTIPVVISKYRVKPGSTQVFQELIKKYGDGHKQLGRAFFMVWRTSMGDQYEYTVLSDIPGVGMLDEPSPLVKAFGEREALSMSYRLSQCLDGLTRMWHIHPEQSIWSQQDFRRARVGEISLRNGSALTEYNREQTKVAAKVREAGRKNYWLLHLDYGGDDYRVLLITPVDKYADLSGTDFGLTRLVGAEEAERITAMREKVTASRHAYLWSYLPELSFRKDALAPPK
jgi:hypothetical protein